MLYAEVLPEITLRSAAVVPPITTFAPLVSMPAEPLRSPVPALLPSALKLPMKLPTMVWPSDPESMWMPSAAKSRMTKPRMVLPSAEEFRVKPLPLPPLPSSTMIGRVL